MILATWNVNSISVRIPHLISWLQQHQPDVLCIQETKVEDTKFPIDKIREIGYEAVFHGQKSYNGVAIISKLPMDKVEKTFRETPELDQARFIKAEIEGNVILNAYIPNGSYVGSDKYEYKLEWFSALRNYLNENQDSSKPVLLCGDFNVAPEDRDIYNPDRHRGEVMCSEQEREALSVIRDWGFVDAFRMHEEQTGHFTWWDYRLLGIYVTESLAGKCKRSWIDIEPRKLDRPSDHTPLVAEFN